MSSPEIILVLTLIAVVSTWLVIPLLSRLSVRAGWIATNYRGIKIPSSGGLMLLPGLSLAWLTYLFMVATLSTLPSVSLIHPALIVVWGFGLLGFLDDQGGLGEHGGFSHHLTALVRGELTTGGIKAIGGGILALAASFSVDKSLGLSIMGAVVIALCANLINLLDLRPGRAVKGFSILMVPAFFAALFQSELAIIVFPALGVVTLVGGRDLRGELMLGDTGANLLGALAGLALTNTGSWTLTAGTLLLVAGLNLSTEKVSISRKIADSPVLSWLDRLGRSD